MALTHTVQVTTTPRSRMRFRKNLLSWVRHQPHLHSTTRRVWENQPILSSHSHLIYLKTSVKHAFLRGHHCLRPMCVAENVTLGNLLSKAVILLRLLNKRNIAFQIRRNVDRMTVIGLWMCSDLLCYLKHAATPSLSLSLSLYSAHHNLIQSMSSVVVTMALNFMKWLVSFLNSKP